MMKAMH